MRPTLPRSFARRLLVVTVLAMAPVVSAGADAGWIEAGDTALRTDLLLLNDAGIIRLPVNQWPMPRAALAFALQNAKEHFATNAAVVTALARVRARVTRAGRFESNVSLTAGSAARLRDFDTPGREDAELRARAGFDFGRAAVSLNVTGAARPADGQEVRFDGSHATVALGNWLVSANTLDRWWGPAHESSLILSSNARPMPTFAIERATARPFETPFLSWLGPWRFHFALSRMEDERQDVDAPLFLAWRVTVMPFEGIELGISRTAQFCGEQQACDFSTFTDLLIGRDNAGIDATLEEEPGNQMAGFDIRWSSPIGELPYAVYSQMIGEDESSFLPVKYLAQFGVEVWKPLVRGGIVQGFFEYSDITCSAERSPPRFDCAYNQRQFNLEGYRYRGRSLGHTADNDSEMIALGATYTAEDGTLWSAVGRTARLNRGGVEPDDRNTVSGLPADYRAIEFGWRGELLGESVAIELGAESYRADGTDRAVDAFGFVSWRHEFGR